VFHGELTVIPMNAVFKAFLTVAAKSLQTYKLRVDG
jgi:hypothetical protein